jgi:predicted enzyme related to lactoylglutathione lyase
MANIDTYAPGSFCWFELGTTDQDGAKSFYKSLFGWEANDMPMGPGNVYTMFLLDGRNPGAAYTLMPEMRAHGVPPHWGIYIAVANVDEAAAKAAAAGGTVIKGPFDVYDVGRMAVVQDPTGAHFHLWQEKRPHSEGISGVPGTFCWADLNTHDVPKAAQFYTTLFGWEIAPGEHDQSGYLHIKNGDSFIGGIPPTHVLPPNVPPHWMLYFQVADVEASTKQLVELGGKLHMGPITIEKTGKFSVVSDPQGASFAFFTPSPR